MDRFYWSKSKIFFILSILLVYLLFAGAVTLLISQKYLIKYPSIPEEIEESDSSRQIELINSSISSNFNAAKYFVRNNLVRANGHVNLYYTADNSSIKDKYSTNSEAVSYYVLWNALDRNKIAVDSELEYVEKYMMDSKNHYLFWRLEENDQAIGDGKHIASDADIRLIKALLISRDQWPDKNYANKIDLLSSGLERTVITKDKYLAPYGGFSENGELLMTNEVWLSYSDFNVFRSLAFERGSPWKEVYHNMKEGILLSQVPVGLYRTELDSKREYHNNLDGGNFGINSLWIMVRSAESQDKELRESAQKALDFYKIKYRQDGKIFTVYDINGEAASDYDAVWVYALAGRAAIELNDEEFSREMINEIISKQIIDPGSGLYGALPEDSENNIVSQFTMQESIITMQAYAAKH